MAKKVMTEMPLIKTAGIESTEISQADLNKINQYTLEDLTADDVFAFKVIAADNEQDDRNGEPFNLKSLKNMKKLYPGKTVLKNHNRRDVDVQIGRVYAAELVTDPERKTELGEDHTDLILKIYIVKTAGNADLIQEIKAGIKKEVSTSTVPEKLFCNICQTENMKSFCRHYPGIKYRLEDGSGQDKICKMIIDGVKEAYELSFVTVPSQPRAGTTKSENESENLHILYEEKADSLARKRLLDSYSIY